MKNPVGRRTTKPFTCNRTYDGGSRACYETPRRVSPTSIIFMKTTSSDHQTGSETEIQGGRVNEAVDTEREACPFKGFGCK